VCKEIICIDALDESEIAGVPNLVQRFHKIDVVHF
jgi:hypothetical protein